MNHPFAVFARHYAAKNWPIFVVSLLTWMSVVTCLDPGGSYPNLPEGPGLTVDEFFNVFQGVYLVKQAEALGWLNVIPGTSQEAYRVENGYLPDHPPLGRWWLGLHHQLTWWLFPPVQPEDLFVTACARTGSATAFAMTVLIVGLFVAASSGQAAGTLAALSLVFMPRVYGHAHLASLETITNLSCTAAVLSIAKWWNGPLPPSRRVALLTGALLGLAFLSKIQAVLIPLPVIGWALWRWRSKALIPLCLWGVAAIVVFFVGWPYLWFDSTKHVLEYLGRTTNRATLQVWYFGEKFPDKLVPWHYPFVIFGLTVPVVLHALGLLESICVFAVNFRQRRGIGRSKSEVVSLTSKSPPDIQKLEIRNWNAIFEQDVLLISCMLFPLIVFAIPGIAVYDGERLFLTSFPLWALFVGRGWVTLWRFVNRGTNSRMAAGIVCSTLIVQVAVPLFSMSPCHLCYYNEITSYCLGGATRAGLEIDYWGVGITRGLLKRTVDTVPEGTHVAISPTMHQFQADDYRSQSPILRAHQVKTVEFQSESASQQFILIYHRHADLPSIFNDDSSTFQILDTIKFGDEPLASLLRRKD